MRCQRPTTRKDPQRVEKRGLRAVVRSCLWIRRKPASSPQAKLECKALAANVSRQTACDHQSRRATRPLAERTVSFDGQGVRRHVPARMVEDFNFRYVTNRYTSSRRVQRPGILAHFRPTRHAPRNAPLPPNLFHSNPDTVLMLNAIMVTLKKNEINPCSSPMRRKCVEWMLTSDTCEVMPMMNEK